jgi:hypothetical protein
MLNNTSRRQWKRLPFGCDNAGSPILEEYRDTITGIVYGELVKNSPETQRRLNELVDDYLKRQAESK